MNQLSPEERKILRRIADEPTYWIRQYFPELQANYHNAFFDLVDRMKALWQEVRPTRVDLCFALRMEITAGGLQTIDNTIQLQRQQQEANSRRVFEIDLAGNVVGEIDCEAEIEPVTAQQLSQGRSIALFWLGPDFQIFCKGYVWTPKNKTEVLREIKSKKRRSLLSMTDYKRILQTHFEQYLRDGGGRGVKYWFKHNELLQPSPEEIFQESLWSFIDLEVDCIEVAREPMFKDASRCDIKIIAENYDLYFIEVKWIGKSAVRKRETGDVLAKPPHEFTVLRAIDGAYQTKAYIDKHNSAEYDNRIKLGIYLVYDAYNPPKIPIDYGSEINNCVLLRPMEFALHSVPPSTATRGIAKRKGLGK